MGKESSKKHATSKKQVQAKGKGKTKEKASTASSGVSECESENEYLLQLLDLKATCADWNNLFSRSLDEDRRMMQWQYASTMGDPLLQKYAWAVPSNAAIKLLTKFSPLVEMGCGKGYWAHLVQQRGGYVTPFDITVPADGEAWTKVLKGTPESILSPTVAKNKKAPLKDLNLFLCYPDQGNEVGLPSLDAFQELTDEHNNFGQGTSAGIGGGYVIHVGELLVTGCVSGAPQAPWGRTSSSDFQQRLYADYHCVISLPLESFPFSRDFLTVWKRTVMFDAKEMEFLGDTGSDDEEVEDDEDSEEVEDSSKQRNNEVKASSDEESNDELNDQADYDEDSEDGAEENEDEWADIPSDERLPHLVQATVAPCMQKLFNDVLS